MAEKEKRCHFLLVVSWDTHGQKRPSTPPPLPYHHHPAARPQGRSCLWWSNTTWSMHTLLNPPASSGWVTRSHCHMFLQATLVHLHSAPTASHPSTLQWGLRRGMCAKSLTPTLWCNTIPRQSPASLFICLLHQIHQNSWSAYLLSDLRAVAAINYLVYTTLSVPRVRARFNVSIMKQTESINGAQVKINLGKDFLQLEKHSENILYMALLQHWGAEFGAAHSVWRPCPLDVRPNRLISHSHWRSITAAT